MLHKKKIQYQSIRTEDDCQSLFSTQTVVFCFLNKLHTTFQWFPLIQVFSWLYMYLYSVRIDLLVFVANTTVTTQHQVVGYLPLMRHLDVTNYFYIKILTCFVITLTSWYQYFRVFCFIFPHTSILKHRILSN